MLAAIDAAEQQALAAPNTEFYVGFWELGAGGAEPLPPASSLPPHAAVLAVGGLGRRSLSLSQSPRACG
eukprot:3864407-Prymnesium_polylepis.1